MTKVDNAQRTHRVAQFSTVKNQIYIHIRANRSVGLLLIVLRIVNSYCKLIKIIMPPKRQKKQLVVADIQFKVCDVVFAKLFGYPKWPAQINSVERNKYTVVFFGTYDW